MRRAGLLLFLMIFLGPRSSAGSPYAFIPNSFDDTVSVIDTDGDEVVATVPVGRSPYAVAITPDAKYVFISNEDDATTSIIDVETLRPLHVVSAGGAGLATDPRGGYVYALGVSWDINKRTLAVSKIRTQDFTIVKTNTLYSNLDAGMTAHTYDTLDIAIDTDGSSLYVFATVDSEMYPCANTYLGCRIESWVINTAALSASFVGAYGGIQGAPNELAISPNGSVLYVTKNILFDDGTLSGSLSAYAIAPGAQVMPRIRLPSPFGVATNDTGAELFITERDSGTLDVVDALTGQLTDHVNVGNEPMGVGVHPLDGRIYVVNHGSNSVSVIEPIGHTVVRTIQVGSGPIAIGRFIGPGNPPSTPPSTRTPTSSPTPPATPSPSDTPSPSPTPCACVGDCGGTGSVTIEDLLKMINVALGSEEVFTCESGDQNRDSDITIDEILLAVANALNGCTCSTN